MGCVHKIGSNFVSMGVLLPQKCIAEECGALCIQILITLIAQGISSLPFLLTYPGEIGRQVRIFNSTDAPSSPNVQPDRFTIMV